MYKCASFQFFWAGTSLLILVMSYYTLITNLFGYFLTSTEVLFCNLQLGGKIANIHVLTNVLFAWLFIK